MTMGRGLFVRKDDTRGTTPIEARAALAGLLLPGDVGGALTGMEVSGTDGWAYQVAAGVATFVRGTGDGAIVAANDSAAFVPCDPAPASGSRWDLIWALHNDVDGGDANSAASLGVTSGTATGTPSKPYSAVPPGATILAEAQLGSSAATTQDASITQTAQRIVTRGGIVPVRNTTERNALAARVGATSGNPLYVHRADAPAGGQLEVTTNGSTWRTIWDSGTTPQTLSISSGWVKYPDPYNVPRVYRDGSTVFLTAGALARTGSTFSVSAGILYTVASGIPTDLRPADAVIAGGAVHYSGPPTFASLRVTTGGSVQFVATGSGTVPLDASGYVEIPPMQWRYQGAS